MKRRIRQSKKPNRKEFEHDYYNTNTTVKELAKKYEVAQQTIYQWAYEFRKEQK